MDYENFYENLEEATFRLNSSIVLYDGEPVQINNVENHKDGTLRVHISPLPLSLEGNAMSSRKMINSPKFNKFRPFELGNVNYLHKDTIYVVNVERLPVRTRVQGTTSTNTRITTVNKKSGLIFNFSNLTMNEGFVEMCKGVYPSLKEFFDSGVYEIALSRNFAVVKGEATGLFSIYHGTDHIGVMNSKAAIFVFPKFKYLKEVLEESRIFNSVNTTIFE